MLGSLRSTMLRCPWSLLRSLPSVVWTTFSSMGLLAWAKAPRCRSRCLHDVEGRAAGEVDGVFLLLAMGWMLIGAAMVMAGRCFMVVLMVSEDMMVKLDRSFHDADGSGEIDPGELEAAALAHGIVLMAKHRDHYIRRWMEDADVFDGEQVEQLFSRRLLRSLVKGSLVKGFIE